MRSYKRLSLGSFSTTLLVAISILSGVEGLIKVRVNQDMCNSASETTTLRAKSIIDQINDHTSPSGVNTMSADWTWDSLMQSMRGVREADVFYLGPGGTEHDNNKMSEASALNLVMWMKEGHGAVFTSHSQVALGTDTVPTIIENVAPFKYDGHSKYCKPVGANPISMTVNQSLAGHYLLRNVQNSWNLHAQCYVSPSGASDDAVSVASFGKGSGACYDTSNNDVEIDITADIARQGIMYREVVEGDKVSRSVWLCAPYCGYDLYQPFNLRSGPDEQIFANALEWASGLCRDVNDCNAHGSCVGKDTCECDPGYTGTDCSSFSCDGGCGDGTCIGGNTCQCTGNRAGTNCETCKDGWHGKDCTVPVNIKDGNFTEGDAWWEAADGAVIGGGKATFSGAGQSLTQRAFFPFPYYGEKTFITFEASVPEGAELLVYIDGDLRWNSSADRMAGSFGYVDVSAYANDDEVECRTVEFVASAVAGAAATVTNVMSGYTTCVDPGCVFGECVHRLGCVCMEHYGGEDCTTAVCGDGFIVYGQEECDDGNTVSGDGCSSTCTSETGFSCQIVDYKTVGCKAVCGDGLIVNGEECDDGNTKSNDGCSSECKVELGCECTGVPSVCSWKCGNNYISGDEECDSENALEGCTSCRIDAGYDCRLADYSPEAKLNGPSTCKKEACGDGSRTRSEECDNGNLKDDGSTGCTTACKVAPGWDCAEDDVWGTSVCVEVCGNGVRSYSEACDDGNAVDGDGCSAACQVEAGWKCSGGVGSASVCTEVCGDGIKTAGEECDDGNTADGDGCSAACKKEAGWDCREIDESRTSTCQKEVCGDGIRTRSEECDDGNTDDEDGCSSACLNEYGWECAPNDMWGLSDCHEVCGNGIKTASEVCDDGNTADGDGCAWNCTEIESGYKCDLNSNGKSICRKLCGDGVRTEDEECDDGNPYSGDGCSYNCKIEDGFRCTVELQATSACHAVCGDGLTITNYEGCDDGNTADGDGCSSACQVEHGWDCVIDEMTRKATCTSTCGNGLVSNLEECDDKNTAGEDGCSAACKIEEGWECVGEPSVCTPLGRGNGHVNTDEECDDGNTANGDGCSSDGKVEEGWDCSGGYAELSVCHRKVCGDGVLTSDEECDDGNTKSNDGCSSECKVERGYSCRGKWGSTTQCYPRIECGNGLITNGEECDDGNTESGDGCSATCKLEPGYSCKLGPGSNNKPVAYYYPTVCRKVECGDGITEGDEECDDGNTVDGDGCSAACKLEPGYSCQGTVCQAYCGNGVIGEGEECDDGNLNDNDGCSGECKLEVGWNYTVDPVTGETVIASTCGDGIVASNEYCDDGNVFSGDGCSYDCQIEDGFRCTGSPSVCVPRCRAHSVSAQVVRHNLCSGLLDGEIQAEMVVLESECPEMNFVAEYKLFGPGYEFPEFAKSGNWTNLAAGTYTVQFYIDRQLESNITVVVGEPQPLEAYIRVYPDGSADIRQPSSCGNNDGAIVITTTGGTPPYKFYMGKRYDENGTFTKLGYKEYNYTRIVDANNCSFVLYDTKMDISCNYPKLDKFMRDIWSKGGPSGVTILAVALAVIIACIICYWVWDWKAFKKDNNDEKKFRIEMEKIRSGGDAEE